MSSMSNDKGSVLVFVTLMIVLLMIMVGMGLDTGQLTYSRATGQSAVDAAALAAASAIPTGDINQVRTRATDYNSANTHLDSTANPIKGAHVTLMAYDFANGNLTAAASIGTANAARVALEQNNPYDAGATNTPMKSPLFLTPLFKLFGWDTAPNTQNVSVSAVAVIRSRPAIPIALWSAACPAKDGDVATDVKIQMQHPTNDNQNPAGENSCWTTFLDCSSGAPDIKAGFEVAEKCSGSRISGDLNIGTEICQNRGQVASVLGDAETFFMKDHPDNWWLIPVIGGGGNCDPQNPTKITNWAIIYPKEIVKSGNPKYIRADIMCGKNLINEVTGTCFSHRLVRDTKSGM